MEIPMMKSNFRSVKIMRSDMISGDKERNLKDVSKSFLSNWQNQQVDL